MALRNKIYEPDLQSDRAKTIQGDVIFIDDAESGRKGYYCLGCGKEMQAAIQRKNPNYKSYFSHVPVDKSKGEKPCVFSNREYREILASNILQRLKRIKVPAILKYPHKGNDEYPIQLQDARFIDAHSVKSEVTFYEDEEGNVHWGKNPVIEDRYLLMRPDVVFFDVNDKPILFIELVVTHKIDDEKRIKLRRLGIDTVSVLVPKSSDQDIEKAFKNTKHTKWEYSEEEANTDYAQVAKRTSERVLEFDEDQEEFLERVTNAERAALETLYVQLEKTWELNLTESLNNDLDLKYQELRKLQKEKEKNWQHWKADTMQKYTHTLQESSNSLRLKETNLQKQKKNFNDTLKIWKADILEREAKLKEKDNYLTKLRAKYPESQILKKQLEEDLKMKKSGNNLVLKQDKEEYNSLVKQLKKKSESLKTKKKKLSENLNLLQEKNGHVLQEKREILNSKKDLFKESLVQTSIETLRIMPQDYPKELKPYWQQEDWDAISKVYNAKKTAINEHGNFLTRELGNHGKTLKWFIELMIDDIGNEEE